MAEVILTLQRIVQQRLNEEKVRSQIDEMLRRGTQSGVRRNWKWKANPYRVPSSDREVPPHTYIIEIHLKKVGHKVVEDSKLLSEINTIVQVMSKTGQHGGLKNTPWVITGVQPIGFAKNIEIKMPSDENGIVDVSHLTTSLSVGGTVGEVDIVDFDRALELKDINVPEVLLRGSDAEVGRHPAFRGIYSRASHIRVLASSIQSMKNTEGRRRNHCLMWGEPGCAKSQIFRGFQTLLGHGGSLLLNANSSTKAGIESLFLKTLPQTGVPPVIMIEEIEKTIEAILTVWLSILDERAEVRKITYHSHSKAEARALCFATANDKVLFDRLMGGRPGKPGALSSRFCKALYVPRPDRDDMRRILQRDVKDFGGKMEWVEHCLELADALETNDPRVVVSFLDGGDQLIDGHYKTDMIKLHSLEKHAQVVALEKEVEELNKMKAENGTYLSA